MNAPLSMNSEDLLAVLAQAQELVKQRGARKAKAKAKPSKRAPVSLTDEELLKVLEAARAHRLRDWVLILVTYRHGLRASEALRIRRRDLDDSYIRIRRGKGSEETEQPLQGHDNPLLNEIEAVRIWLLEMGERGKKGAATPGGRRSRAKTLQSNQNVKSRLPAAPGAAETAGPRVTDEVTGNELLFPLTRQRFFQIFRQYATEAGIRQRKRSPHKLKHSIAKHLLRAGVPPNEVQDWCGWKSMKTMDCYTRADEDEVASSVDQALRGKESFRRLRQDEVR